MGYDNKDGLPLSDITNADGIAVTGVLSTLGLNKEELAVFIVEGSGDTSVEFPERLAAWRVGRTPSGSESSPRGRGLV